MVAASSSDVSLLKGIQTKPISELRLELGIGRVGNVEDDDGGECRNQLRVRPRSRALALEGDAHGEGRTDGSIFPSSWARRKAERLESSMILTEYEPEPRATFSSSDTEKANLLSFDADRIRGAIVPSSKRAYSEAVTSSTSISTTCATLDVTVISVDANTCGDPTSLADSPERERRARVRRHKFCIVNRSSSKVFLKKFVERI